MKINQIFKTHVTEELLNKILFCFNYSEINTTKYFSKEDLNIYGTLELLEDIKDELLQVYLPCKAKKYLNFKKNQNAITILRQILRLFSYKLISKQKYLIDKKVIFYYIIHNNDYIKKNKNNIKISNNNRIINFAGGG